MTTKTTPEYEFTFVDGPPPPNRGRNALYSAFRDALRSRPGEWAIYPREFKNKASATGTTSNINNGRMPTFPPDLFEARTSDMVVYVRYKGDAK